MSGQWEGQNASQWFSERLQIMTVSSKLISLNAKYLDNHITKAHQNHLCSMSHTCCMLLYIFFCQIYPITYRKVSDMALWKKTRLILIPTKFSWTKRSQIIIFELFLLVVTNYLHSNYWKNENDGWTFETYWEYIWRLYVLAQ